MTSPGKYERRPAVSQWPSLIACAAAVMLALFTPSRAAAQTYTVLHNFTGGAGGANPYAGVLVDRAGNLYGTTAAGGAGSCSGYFGTGCGTAYQLNPSNQSFTTLWQFSGGSDGAAPQAGLIVSPGGAMYGSTSAGGGGNCSGQDGCGTVFRLTPPATPPRTIREDHWTETILYSFHGSDGNSPTGNLAVDGSGNLYGSTVSGGGAGNVFKLSNLNGVWTSSALHNFSGYADGTFPQGGVILDAAGNVYGTTFIDGPAGGNVYQLRADSDYAFNILYSFTEIQTGGNPASGVTLDSQGNVYGSTSMGSDTGGGSVFELSSGSWAFNLLYSFSGGEGPMLSNLIFDKAGNLYGTTYSDGPDPNQSYGTVFKLTPTNGTWIYTSLHDFAGGSDGGYPVGNLTFDANGDIYGTTTRGGNLSKCGGQGCGVVFRIRP
jgi:uncharacterized repeat protein (TIGR03803 family)